jgi:ethanolamine ammonia-lyase large subunit
MKKWLNKKSIQELKDFIANASNKNSFFKFAGIDISSSQIKLAKEILSKKEITESYLNKVVLKNGNFIIIPE